MDNYDIRVSGKDGSLIIHEKMPNEQAKSLMDALNPFSKSDLAPLTASLLQYAVSGPHSGSATRSTS